MWKYGVPISYRVNDVLTNQAMYVGYKVHDEHVATNQIPTYENWQVTFDTYRDNKDADSILEVGIYTHNPRQDRLIAAYNQNANEEFPDPSHKVKDLAASMEPSGPVRLRIADAKKTGMHAVIAITPHGNDHWFFRYTISATDTASGQRRTWNGDAEINGHDSHKSFVNIELPQ
jgi:hypothetical protein